MNFENTQSHNAESPNAIQAALQHVEAVRAMLGQWGNVDNSEHEALNAIAVDLKNGVISPAEAISRSNGVFESKNFR